MGLEKNSMFSIATILDPQMMLTCIHVDDKAFVIQSLIQFL